MSGEQTARTWWIGLEHKNDTNDPNKWFWLDGKSVDTSITYEQFFNLIINLNKTCEHYFRLVKI